MNIFHSITALREWRQNQAQRIAFVPTMGNLHPGHVALVEKAQTLAKRVVVSIFVNPLQFGPQEDFAIYPRTLAADVEKLKAIGADAVFAPTAEEMYPTGLPQATGIQVSALAEDLCGKSRPGHFAGVATVVAKLFHIVQPDIAIFGEKDWQQFVIIRQMVDDLNFPLQLASFPTVRLADGLAMSSRNQFLSAQERNTAPELQKTLQTIREAILTGTHEYELLCRKATEELQRHSFRVDYLTVRERHSLRMPTSEDNELIILTAAFLGNTRLIDNTFVSRPSH